MHLPRQQSSQTCTLPHDTGRGDHYTWVRYQIPRVASSFEKFRHPCGWCVGCCGSALLKPPPPPPRALSPLGFNHSIAQGPRAKGVAETAGAGGTLELSLRSHDWTLLPAQSGSPSWNFPDQSKPTLAPPPNQLRRGVWPRRLGDNNALFFGRARDSATRIPISGPKRRPISLRTSPA